MQKQQPAGKTLRWVKATERPPSHKNAICVKVIEGGFREMFTEGRLRIDGTYHDLHNDCFYPSDQIEWLEETEDLSAPASPVEESPEEVDKVILIANRLRFLLKQRGFTQRSFAVLINQPESVVSKWLTGKHNFTLGTILEIETALGEGIISVSGQYNKTAFPVIEGGEEKRLPKEVLDVIEMDADKFLSDQKLFLKTPSGIAERAAYVCGATHAYARRLSIPEPCAPTESKPSPVIEIGEQTKKDDNDN